MQNLNKEKYFLVKFESVKMKQKIYIFVLVAVCQLFVTNSVDPFSTFTFANCPPLHPIAAFEEVSSITSCQTRCLQNSNCDYFVLSKIESICYILEGSIKQFIEDCNLIAGPIDVDVQDWFQDQDQCKVSQYLITFSIKIFVCLFHMGQLSKNLENYLVIIHVHLTFRHTFSHQKRHSA